MGGIWNDEMRYKNKLSRRGKGNRRNRRFVSLQRGDFEKCNYFDCAHNIGMGDRRTNPASKVEPSPSKATYDKRAASVDKATAALSPEQRTINDRPLHRAFAPLAIGKAADGTEVLK